MQLNTSLLDGNGAGKYFYSSGYKLLVDRSELIVSPDVNSENVVVEINKTQKDVTYPLELTFKKLPNEKNTWF